MRQEMLAYARGEEIDVERFYRALPVKARQQSRLISEMTLVLMRLAEKEGLLQEEYLPFSQEQVKRAVLYHDIGMTMIPERILYKIGELTSAEKKVIQKHTIYGGKLIEGYRNQIKLKKEEKSENSKQEDSLNFWHFTAEIATSHHERWDGKGYPFGTLATAIPIVARAVAIIDSYTAIVRGAPYRMALPYEYALLEITENAGTQFDPQLAKVFQQNAEEFFRISLRE